MKSFLVLVTLIAAFAANAKTLPDREFFCNGGEYKNKQAITFVLLLENHDGKNFKKASIENMFFNNAMRDTFETDVYDISKPTMKCAAGKKRTGNIEWTIDEAGGFRFESQCKGDSLQIEAYCAAIK